MKNGSKNILIISFYIDYCGSMPKSVQNVCFALDLSTFIDVEKHDVFV